nr:MAG TPA: hypothetical protein [Caudoviricetes sp.]
MSASILPDCKLRIVLHPMPGIPPIGSPPMKSIPPSSVWILRPPLLKSNCSRL